MTRTTVGDHVVQRLAAWGARRYYGYPGDGIGGLVAGIARAVSAEEAQFVQVRHEETAGFAACADVKYGGSPLGLCVVTSGPGAVHALNGLYDAKMDHVPVLALVGQSAVAALGTSYYQEPTSPPCTRTWRGSTCSSSAIPSRSSTPSTVQLGPPCRAAP